MFVMFATVMNSPAESTDTPIKKIVIRPALHSDITNLRQNRAFHNSKRGRTIENNPLVIKVLKNPNQKRKPQSSAYRKKYNSNIHTLPTGSNSIFYARAKANGSFRHSPIRAFNASVDKF